MYVCVSCESETWCHSVSEPLTTIIASPQAVSKNAQKSPSTKFNQNIPTIFLWLVESRWVSVQCLYFNKAECSWSALEHNPFLAKFESQCSNHCFKVFFSWSCESLIKWHFIPMSVTTMFDHSDCQNSRDEQKKMFPNEGSKQLSFGTERHDRLSSIKQLSCLFARYLILPGPFYCFHSAVMLPCKLFWNSSNCTL